MKLALLFIAAFTASLLVGVESRIKSKPKPAIEITSFNRFCIFGNPHGIDATTASVSILKIRFATINSAFTKFGTDGCADIQNVDSKKIAVNPNDDLEITYAVKTGQTINNYSIIIPPEKAVPTEKDFSGPLSFYVAEHVIANQPNTITSSKQSFNPPNKPAILIDYTLKSRPPINFNLLKSVGFCVAPIDPTSILNQKSQLVLDVCNDSSIHQQFGFDPKTKRIQAMYTKRGKRCIEVENGVNEVVAKLAACNTSKLQKFFIFKDGAIMNVDTRKFITIEGHGVDITDNKPRLMLENRIKRYSAAGKLLPWTAVFSQTWNKGKQSVMASTPLKIGIKCMGVQNSDKSAIAAKCDKTQPSQRWGLDSSGRLVNKAYRSLCLDLTATEVKGKLVGIVSKCANTDTAVMQKWTVQSGGKIFNEATSKYITVGNCGKPNKNVPQPTTYHRIEATDGVKCSGGSTTKQTCTVCPNQQWK